MPDDRPVLLDTDAFSILYIKEAVDPRASRWRELLLGRSAVIAMQTRAELLMGSYVGGWGGARQVRLLARVDPTPTLPVNRAVADRFARLTADLRRDGQGMHQDRHTGDRWIAATALAHGLPLLTGDDIYRQVSDLQLLAGDGGVSL